MIALQLQHSLIFLVVCAVMKTEPLDNDKLSTSWTSWFFSFSLTSCVKTAFGLFSVPLEEVGGFPTFIDCALVIYSSPIMDCLFCMIV